MLRSRSQVLYSYLPGSVFRHEDRVYGRVVSVEGNRLTSLNEAVIYDEIAHYLEQWPEAQRHDLPLPKGERIKDYRIMKPDLVRWELFPLIFECSRRSCARVHSFRTFDDLAKTSRCRRCEGALQQLRFYSAHNCGRIQQMYVPRCTKHGYDDVTFDNTGSFVSATWRCQGEGCNGAVIQRTNMSPCNCRSFAGPDGVVRMRAHTLDDSRAYQAHYIDLVNIDSSTFQDYQRHPARGEIAVAHYLGLLAGIRDGIREANSASSGGERMSAAEWAAKETLLRESGLMSDEEIAVLKSAKGPAETGIAALGGLAGGVLDHVAIRRPVYERAAVFDRSEMRRLALEEQRDQAEGRGDTLRVAALTESGELARAMGIGELAVTWEFPIAKVAFGYTREKHQPQGAALRGFRHQNQNDGKCPVYAVASETEALLVTLSARDVLAFMHARGDTTFSPADEAVARRELLAIFADEDVHPVPANTIRTLVHTLSHLMLRGLDDGQVGFAEASLAEWLVPETLTFAIYANTLKDFTLGSLWTLITSRSLSWLSDVITRSVRCENDPLCYQERPRACERCSYLTFGCRSFNDELDRAVLFDYFSHRAVLGRAAAGVS
jgi:hypothetical protein